MGNFLPTHTAVIRSITAVTIAITPVTVPITAVTASIPVAVVATAVAAVTTAVAVVAPGVALAGATPVGAVAVGVTNSGREAETEFFLAGISPPLRGLEFV